MYSMYASEPEGLVVRLEEISYPELYMYSTFASPLIEKSAEARVEIRRRNTIRTYKKQGRITMNPTPIDN